ncbi:unnamed protein product, partial [Meganyctiphanes norvegica]
MASCNPSGCCDGVTAKLTIFFFGCYCKVPLSHGLLAAQERDYPEWPNRAGMRYRASYDPNILEMAPFFLLPSSFPKREFERVVKLQPLVNELTHRIAHNYEFLKECLKNTIKVDDFTARLWKIYETLQTEGVTQEVSLGLVRSDVMLSQCMAGTCSTCRNPPYVTCHQVEVNTIASGFGHLGPSSALIQRHDDRRRTHSYMMPENTALADLCGGMITAWEMYSNPKAVIMFVVEDVTYNICDQRFHEYEIRSKRPDIYVIRKNLTQLSKATLTDDKRLIIDDCEVAVIYFRAGYEPGHYPTEAEWDARLSMERSRAIKCPSIHYHLAGTKKVQQAVASKGVVEKFLQPEEALLVKQIFTGLYTLDKGEMGDRAVKMAIDNPEKFVLKPQREGGGNNLYGNEIKEELERIKDSSEREAYILMDRIQPPLQNNYVVRPREPVRLVETVSELGIFGVCIGTAEKIVVNKFAGHMLRTKLSNVNEGGVAAGLGALDSVFLFE